MKYEIIKKRGVLRQGEPFIVDEGKPLSIEFEGLPEGCFFLCLKRQNAADGEIVTMAAPHVEIGVYKLKAGIYNVELKKNKNGFITDTIICTPIHIQSLSTMAKGLVCYPEIDAVINRMAELERIVFDLKDWKESVEKKIHEHKTIL